MASSSSPHATAVLHDDDQDIRPAACPMCHTSAPLSLNALKAGGEWRCVRCGQHWDAARLAAVAAYAAWSVNHDRENRRDPGGSHEAGRSGSLPTERPGGTP